MTRPCISPDVAALGFITSGLACLLLTTALPPALYSHVLLLLLSALVYGVGWFEYGKQQIPRLEGPRFPHAVAVGQIVLGGVLLAFTVAFPARPLAWAYLVMGAGYFGVGCFALGQAQSWKLLTQRLPPGPGPGILSQTRSRPSSVSSA